MQFLAKNKKLLELGPSPGFLLKKKRVYTTGRPFWPSKSVLVITWF